MKYIMPIIMLLSGCAMFGGVELLSGDSSIRQINGIPLTYSELTNTATALGMDWATVRGDGEQTVILVAAINKAAGLLELTGDGSTTFKTKMQAVFSAMD